MNSRRAVSETAAEWVNRRAAGLTPTEEAELAAWLAADARHRDAFNRSGRVWSLMDRPHDTGCADTMVNQLAERRRKRVRRRIVATGTGTLAALALLMVAYHLPRAVPTPPAPTLPSTAVLAEVRRQSLPDGSLLEFKADAQVATQFTPDERRVRLVRGETHFQVKSDVARPFIVVANGVEVRAVGTAFAIRLDEQSIDVLVTEGRVAVAPRAAEIGGRRSEVRGQRSDVSNQRSEVEGQRSETTTSKGPTDQLLSASSASPSFTPLYIDAGSRAMVSTFESFAKVQVTDVTPAEQERSLAWRYPRLEFSGTRLTDAVKLFNGHAAGQHRIKLRIGDADLGDLEVSGFFRTDNVEGFVRLLEGSFGVTADRTSESEIVLRRAR
jgi:transmembrane sensor